MIATGHRSPPDAFVNVNSSKKCRLVCLSGQQPDSYCKLQDAGERSRPRSFLLKAAAPSARSQMAHAPCSVARVQDRTNAWPRTTRAVMRGNGSVTMFVTLT